MLRLSALLLLIAAMPLTAQVVISEVMTANATSIRDEDGLSADWVELHNVTAREIRLGGWTLGSADERPWKLPDVAIAPLGFQIVFLTGKNRSQPDRPLHADFRISRRGGELVLKRADGQEVDRMTVPILPSDVSFAREMIATRTEFVAGDAPLRYQVHPGQIGKGWPGVAFDDGDWHEGQGAFGHARDPQGAVGRLIRTDASRWMYRKATSSFLRYAFDASDVSKLKRLVLQLRYLEGFVCYLNGEEVARSDAPDKLEVTSRAIESWRYLPPGDPEEFVLVGAERLLKEGRNVLGIHGLSRSTLNDHLIAPRLIGFGASRMGDRRGFADAPTPGWCNDIVREAITPPPVPDRDGGLFEEPFVISVAGPPDATIRFTTDGSNPRSSSPALREGRVRVEETGSYRFRAFVKGQRPSEVRGVDCIRIDPSLREFRSNLPLVVITTFGRDVHDRSKVDAHLSVIPTTADGVAAVTLSQVTHEGRIGLKTRGSSTLRRPKKAYSIDLQAADGSDAAVSLLGMPAHSDWVLYGAYNYDEAGVRNVLIYELARRIGLDTVRTRFCEAFVNPGSGRLTKDHYVGLYVLMEKISPGRQRMNVGRLDPSHRTAPAITGGYILKVDRPGPGEKGFTAGAQALKYVSPKERVITDAQKRWLSNYIDGFGRALNSSEFADPVNGYAAYIDVDNFIDFHLLNEFAKNPDAYTLSTYLYKRRGRKLRMGPVWDFDRSFRTNDDPAWVGKASSPEGWTRDCYYSWWGILFRDPAFRARYRARGRALFAKVWSAENVHALLGEIVAKVRDARERDRRRWPLLRPGEWENEIIDLERWITDRVNWFRAELLEIPEFVVTSGSPVPPLTLEIQQGNTGGDIWYTVDGSDPRLKDGSISPRAVKYTGPFKIERDMNVRARVRVGETFSRQMDRVYYRSLRTLAITEIMFNPKGGRDYEFIEVTNTGRETVDLTDVELIGDVRFNFNNGDVRKLAPGRSVVLLHTPRPFEKRYGSSGIVVAGELRGRMSNTGGAIELRGPAGELLAQARWSDAWFPETDGRGKSLVLLPGFDGRRASTKATWRASEKSDGSPGRR